MGQTADQLRQEIDQKRDDAAQKIDELQSQVQGAAQKVTDTAMQVKDSFDIRRQIEERPLLALGAALVGGFLLGGMGGGGGQGQRSSGGNVQRDWESGGASSGAMSGIRRAAQSSGLEDTLSHAASALMGSIADRLRDTLDQSFPGFADKLQEATQRGGSSGSDGDRGMEARGSVSTSPATSDTSGRPAPYYVDAKAAASNRPT